MMILAVAILLVGAHSSLAQDDLKTCCSPSFQVTSFALGAMFPSTMLYDTITGNRLANTTDAIGTPITILLNATDMRQYIRTPAGCQWRPAPYLENGRICVNGDATYLGNYTVDGSNLAHYTQSVGGFGLKDDMWVDKDCVPMITQMSLNSDPIVFSSFYDLEVLQDGSAANEFDTSDCILG